MLLKIYPLALTIYGFYQTTEKVSFFALLLVCFMIIGWILQIVFEVFGAIFTNRFALIMDGVKADGHMLTQVIGYDEASDRLISPLSNEENATDRPTAAAAVSRDVNKDGILEIPTAELTINGSETTADSTGYVITWNTYSLQDNTSKTIFNV